jgi:cytochrome b subunit of formate dehydrogenase
MSLKPKWNLLLNSVIAVGFLVTALTGLVFFFGLAGAGYQGGRVASQSWLLARDAWRSLHDWFGLAMIAGVTVHLVVHWKWIAATVKRNVLGAFRGGREKVANPAQPAELGVRSAH